MADNASQHPVDLPVDKLTWSVLLARWVEFARSAVALPTEGEGATMRASVADIIMLQAVWFSLGHMDDLTAEQRALGLDRAAVLIDKHASALETRWAAAMPDAMRELIADAREQLKKAKNPGELPPPSAPQE
jgi:hypothetical protein